jgi:hypothetical protein
MMASSSLEMQSDFFHSIFAEWLDDPETTVACGNWSDGAVSELMPGARGHLLPARYSGCFAGVRELRLDDCPHHLHVDFGRVHKVCYAVAPSVCLDFKPSFEARFLTTGPGGAPTDRWSVALMHSRPYEDGKLRPDAIKRFFDRAYEHAQRQPSLVDLQIDQHIRASAEGAQLLDLLGSIHSRPAATWDTLLATMKPPVPSGGDFQVVSPTCLPLLEQALKLRDASLVIYRDRTLVEFKSDKLDGVHRYEEQGHISWQIGAFDDHHCHLALASVRGVLFSAEPVPCQGGGLNYTVWFLASGSTSNPWRRDGYFSITLNSPYCGQLPRLEVVEPVLDLYHRFRSEPWVQADHTFMRVINEGVPSRPWRGGAGRA